MSSTTAATTQSISTCLVTDMSMPKHLRQVDQRMLD